MQSTPILSSVLCLWSSLTIQCRLHQHYEQNGLMRADTLPQVITVSAYLSLWQSKLSQDDSQSLLNTSFILWAISLSWMRMSISSLPLNDSLEILDEPMKIVQQSESHNLRCMSCPVRFQ
jgi:hypothetical protein